MNIKGFNQDRLMWLASGSSRQRPVVESDQPQMYETDQRNFPQTGDLNLSLQFGIITSDTNPNRVKLWYGLQRLDPLTTNPIIDGGTYTIYVYGEEDKLPLKALTNIAVVLTTTGGVPENYPATASVELSGDVTFTNNTWFPDTSIPSDGTMIGNQLSLESNQELAYEDQVYVDFNYTITPAVGRATTGVFTVQIIMCKFLERFQYVHRPDIGFPAILYPNADQNPGFVSARDLNFRGICALVEEYPSGPDVPIAIGSYKVVYTEPHSDCARFPNIDFAMGSPLFGSSWTLPSDVYRSRTEFSNSLIGMFPAPGTVSGVIHERVTVPLGIEQYTTIIKSGKFETLPGNYNIFQIGTGPNMLGDWEIIENTEDVTNTIRAMPMGGTGPENIATSYYQLCNGTDGSTPNTSNNNTLLLISPFGPPNWGFAVRGGGEWVVAFNYLRQYVDPSVDERPSIPRPMLITLDAKVPLTEDEYLELTKDVPNTSPESIDALGEFLDTHPGIADKLANTNYQIDMMDPRFVNINNPIDPTDWAVVPNLSGEIQLNPQFSFKDGVKLAMDIYGGVRGVQSLLQLGKVIGQVSTPLAIASIVMAGIKFYRAYTAVEGAIDRDSTIYRIPQDMSTFIARHPEYAPRPGSQFPLSRPVP